MNEKDYINGIIKGLSIAHNYYLEGRFDSAKFLELKEYYFLEIAKD